MINERYTIISPIWQPFCGCGQKRLQHLPLSNPRYAPDEGRLTLIFQCNNFFNNSNMRHTITSGIGRGYWSTSVTEQVLLCSTTPNFNKLLYKNTSIIYKNQKNFPEHVIISIHTKIKRTFQNIIIKVVIKQVLI